MKPATLTAISITAVIIYVLGTGPMEVLAMRGWINADKQPALHTRSVKVFTP